MPVEIDDILAAGVGSAAGGLAGFAKEKERRKQEFINKLLEAALRNYEPVVAEETPLIPQITTAEAEQLSASGIPLFQNIKKERLPTTQDIEQGIPMEFRKKDMFPFENIPEGYEIIGYDQKGNPMIRKIKSEKPLATIEEEAKSRARGQEAGKRLPAETAGKLALIETAISSLKSLQPYLFDKQGNLDYGTVVKMNVPFTAGVGEAGRSAYARIYDAVEAKLRIETGAAATQAEVERIAKRYIPSLLDNTKTAKEKLQRLNDFMLQGRAYIDPNGRFTIEENSNPKQFQSDLTGNEIQRIPKTTETSVQGTQQGISEEDIAFTMNKYGMTREQVLNRLKLGR